MDDSDEDAGVIFVGWSQGASEEQRDAHDQALTWALASQRQIQRVRKARLHFVAEHERAITRGVYDDESAEPPRRMQAEIAFMFIAARQLMRALKRFDGDHRPRQGLDSRRVHLLRNALVSR